MYKKIVKKYIFLMMLAENELPTFERPAAATGISNIYVVFFFLIGSSNYKITNERFMFGRHDSFV